MSVALTFPVSSPGPLGLRKWFLSAPGALGSSLSFTGKSSFVSLWATARDTDSSTVMSADQPTCASQPGCPQLLQHCGGGAQEPISMWVPGQRKLAHPRTFLKVPFLQAPWEVPPHWALGCQLGTPPHLGHCLPQPGRKVWLLPELVTVVSENSRERNNLAFLPNE